MVSRVRSYVDELRSYNVDELRSYNEGVYSLLLSIREAFRQENGDL